MSLLNKCLAFIILIVSQIPLWRLLVYAFNSSLTTQFEGFSVCWIIDVLTDKEALIAIANSLLLAIISATISLLMATLFIYVRFMYKGYDGWIGAVANALQSFSIMPEMIVSIVLFSSLLKTQDITGISLLGMRCTISWFLSLIFLPPMMLAIMEQLKLLDDSIFDAAQDLGASATYAFWRCKMKSISMPLVGMWLFAFLWMLDDFMLTTFLGAGGIVNMQTYTYAVAQTGYNTKLNAVALIAFIVILVVLGIISVFCRYKRKDIQCLYKR